MSTPERNTSVMPRVPEKGEEVGTVPEANSLLSRRDKQLMELIAQGQEAIADNFRVLFPNDDFWGEQHSNLARAIRERFKIPKHSQATPSASDPTK